MRMFAESHRRRDGEDIDVKRSHLLLPPLSIGNTERERERRERERAAVGERERERERERGTRGRVGIFGESHICRSIANSLNRGMKV